MKKKQVIFFMSDTTRKDMIGTFNPDMKTPNIDELANQGIAFSNAYSCQPVCGPARSAIFTGQFPHTNGMVGNCMSFGQNIKTLGQRLQEGGIKAGYCGKYHLDGGDYFGYGICPDGWDETCWYDQKNYLDSLETDENRKRSRNSKTSFEEDFSEEFTFAHRVSDKAITFLDDHQTEDFFLTVSYDEPHGPCLCPAPFNHMYDGYKFPNYPNFDDNLEGKPFLQKLWAGDRIYKSEAEVNAPWSLFLGANSFMDYELGRVMKVINEKYPDAIVIYTSDHGDMIGSHKLWNKDSAAYKEIANIPFIIKGFGKKGISDTMVSHIDFVPTILDYFNQPLSNNLEGKSMLPFLKGEEEKVNDYVFTEWTRYEVDHDGFGGLQMMRAITSQDYKLVINLMDIDELYDLKKDPYEISNLINDKKYAAIRNHLHDKLLEHMNKTRDVYRGYQWQIRSWRQDLEPKWEVDGYTRQKHPEKGQNLELDYATGLPISEFVRHK